MQYTVTFNDGCVIPLILLYSLLLLNSVLPILLID